MPIPAPRLPKPLFELLLRLFRSNDDLVTFLENYDYSRALDLVNALPSPTVSRMTFTLQAVQQVQAHGLDNQALFASLTDRFPAQADLIDAARREYLTGSKPEPDPADYSQPLAPAFEPDLTGSALKLEKIMGERPTFLDVAYLATGYQRSKSVAKLRMLFQSGWYSGTAFLVGDRTLLTAHHNLWMGPERAARVEVIFDYERSPDGKDREISVYPAPPDSFEGDADDDWAVLKLDEPQAQRPHMPLSDKPAKEGDRVAIIQHPSGLPKQVALHHNLVTYAGERRLQYLTDTLPGSSGSPVFDIHWNVVAVHHMGGELTVPEKNLTVYRNQGIPIARIRAACKNLTVS